jgi:hypothetical protein
MSKLEDRIKQQACRLNARVIAAAALLALLLLALCPGRAHAHDPFGNPNWIADGHYASPIDGTHCCGEGDCAAVEKEQVTEVRTGLHVRGRVTYSGAASAGDIVQEIDEVVPHREVQPSKDGRYWRCKRPDGSRRCFFGPPPGS